VEGLEDGDGGSDPQITWNFIFTHYPYLYHYFFSLSTLFLFFSDAPHKVWNYSSLVYGSMDVAIVLANKRV
jgi:hypothetical protein